MNPKKLNIRKLNKFNAQRADAFGIVFDSQKERDYFLFLKGEEQKGKIKKIQLQPNYELLPAQLVEQANGRKKQYAPITYTPDFFVEWKDGRKEIIEVKGFKTEPYRMRKKMLLYLLRDRDDLTFIET